MGRLPAVGTASWGGVVVRQVGLVLLGRPGGCVGWLAGALA